MCGKSELTCVSHLPGSLFLLCVSRRVEELQSQLAEEKERAAHLNEQQAQELSRREQLLAETKDTFSSEASSLQEKISHLVRSQPASVWCSAARLHVPDGRGRCGSGDGLQ